MKRCPECLFIYPETDVRCDFDNTALVVVDDAELEAATEAPTSKKSKRTPKKGAPKSTARKSTSRKATKIVVPVIGLLFVLVAISVYYTLGSRTHNTIEPVTIASLAKEPIARPQQIIVAPAPSETASPSPAPSATPKQTPERVATSHSRTTAAPISTSGPGMGKKLGGKPVIVLTTGARIDADEVWRTRDGVWYRRNGIVTLLKHNRVKAISN
jgi:hypothetical protein